MNLQPRLSDDCVELIPLQESDFQRLYEVASDPLIWEQHPQFDRYKRDVFQKYFDTSIKSNGALLIFDKASGELIGCTQFYEQDPENSSVAIGFTFISRKYWGNKHNKAAKNLMMDYAFNYVDNIIFHIGVDNIRSQKAVEKLGAVQIKTVNFNILGEEIPHYVYEIKKPV